MTDTGQVPGEGLPESAGRVEQPGVPAHGMYTYLSETTVEDEDLLMPGAQSAWGNEVPPPAPEPVVEAVHQPGPHEASGRDSGSVDLGGVRLPDSPVSVPPSPILSAPHDQAATPRRPLHMGPPIPNASASPVRSLADRGPAGAPVRQPGPPTTGPEYLDVQALPEVAPQGAAPWGAAQAPAAQGGSPAPVAEAVTPLVEPAVGLPGAAQAAVARLATEAAVGGTAEPTPAPGFATAAAPADAAVSVQGAAPEGPQAVHGHDGMQPVHGHDGVYGAPAAQETGPAQGPAAAPGAEGGQGAEAAQPSAGAQVPGGTGEQEAAAARVAGAPDGAQGPVVPQGAEGAEAQDAPVLEEQAPEGPQFPQVPQGQAPGGPQFPQAEGPQFPQAEGAQLTEAEGARTQTPAAGVPGVQVAVPPAQAVAPVTPVAPVAPVAGAGPAQPGVPGPASAAEAVQAPEPVAVVQETPEAEAIVSAPDAVPTAPTGATVATPAAGTPVPADTQPTQPDAVAQALEPAHPAADETPQAVGPVSEQPPAEEAQQPEPGQEPQAVAADSARTEEAPAVIAVPPQEPVGPEADAAQPAVEPAAPHAQPQAQPSGPVVAEAPQSVPPAAVALPATDEAATEAGAPEAAPEADAPAAAAVPEQVAPGDSLPGGVPLVAHPDQPLGQFVPVEGSVPTTPHLAPTPPQPLILPLQEPPAAAPEEPAAMVPAPREAEPAPVPAAPDVEPSPEVVQHAEDLETRAADQEESTAAVAEARQSTGSAAPAYDDAEREAVLKVMRERRDIRNGFRNDPIPHEVLLRVLEAAHTAPSVGHSQPWDFVVIRSAETRRTMHELAMRQRDAYAKSLPKGRAKQFKELKIEAILDTPVNIVVTADPTRGGRHTLGRHTQPQMAPYSAALAVENLWLAARAEGLGVGWVSFFDEREMVRALGLPEHLEVIAYLCVGYVDEFPDEPELMQAGWSKRRPLSWVVHEETYGRRALPGEDPHDLLAETVAGIRPLDAKALGEAWERQKRMTKPAGALGMLEIISAQLSGLSRQCPPPIPEPAAVAIFAGDHGVHAQGVTPWPQEVTGQMVANFLGGGAVCNAFANQVGAEVCVVDVGVASDLPATPGLLPRKVRAGTSDMTTGPAMTREEAKAAIEVGIETARDLVAAGNKALLTGEMGIANTTASAALISVFTGADPAEVTGRGTGINDETLARKTEVVRRAIELHQPDPADPIGVLAAIGGFEHAAIVGLLLGGASLRTPVILDGVSAGAAALVARAIAPEVLAACIAGHRSAEPGHVAALNKLGLRPLVDLDLRLGEGTGALLALPLVQSTARAMHEVATFDSAGVTEK
ncbi:nicotinate-nucleotide--dimethylbenzimidazole phosphoribosyltransferase [Streptomyces herbicida]|uniref:nicotinate-nucleotide--dimethylbenzimidazole phosphoribosyltransferase n=1 Tax=Streptomyces herbicida TaxID=3065675 RepID=UPI00292F7858|nr:nicotinate-nucleotide--dimethylbenzimidazole phosphoribosyltransferase [Streptomyces sp. NEAU-HV9]